MPSPSSSSSRSDQPESHELLKRPRSLSAPSAPSNSANHNDDHDPASDSDSSDYELDDLDDLEASSRLLRNGGRAHKPHFSSSPSPLIRWWCASCASRLRILVRRSVGIRHRFLQFGFITFAASLSLLVFTFIFNPSYTRDQYPSNYKVVTTSVRKGGGENPKGFWKGDGKGKVTISGRGNPDGVKVFIAANIINAELISGAWGDAVMELMDMIGEKNVFLSVFENDSGPLTKAALNSLDTTVASRMPLAGRSIVSTTLALSSIPRVKLPTGETYIKRITYLAEIRNRAILPLIGHIPSMKRWGQKKHWVEKPELYGRVLFLNDVVFDPVQALLLLFSTNGGEYTAACGMDFINPLKFYDTFATRDIDGWNSGVPFFPFFAPGGSRGFVERGSDAVPVKSCWGGIVAFDAKVFFKTTSTATPDSLQNTPHRPVLFRSEKEPYWDASECCLIHADIAAANSTFINPFIRVAYSESTFGWLPAVKRIERLFLGPHWVLAKILGMPWGGQRRTVGGAGYCGSTKLLVMKEEGGRGWKGIPVPGAR
ncbi:cryptococcal mannosyltransferase 1-domain-containing protein [Morchella snyderi]|nr:cryptococcal mannosyltransferase 1-domain-containing protein [Morchella snyderi]